MTPQQALPPQPWTGIRQIVPTKRTTGDALSVSPLAKDMGKCVMKANDCTQTTKLHPCPNSGNRSDGPKIHFWGKGISMPRTVRENRNLTPSSRLAARFDGWTMDMFDGVVA